MFFFFFFLFHMTIFLRHKAAAPARGRLLAVCIEVQLQSIPLSTISLSISGKDIVQVQLLSPAHLFICLFICLFIYAIRCKCRRSEHLAPFCSLG